MAADYLAAYYLHERHTNEHTRKPACIHTPTHPHICRNQVGSSFL
jgi:hypothetical protein